MISNPRFEHDCDECVFLKRFGDADLYFHPGSLESVIARFSDEPSDYISGLNAPMAALIEARREAIECGMFSARKA